MLRLFFSPANCSKIVVKCRQIACYYLIKIFNGQNGYMDDITIPPETYRKRPPETDITTPSNLLPSTSSTSTRIDANLLDLKPSEVSSKT